VEHNRVIATRDIVAGDVICFVGGQLIENVIQGRVQQNEINVQNQIRHSGRSIVKKQPTMQLSTLSSASTSKSKTLYIDANWLTPSGYSLNSSFTIDYSMLLR
jgi:hypothetical protein